MMHPKRIAWITLFIAFFLLNTGIVHAAKLLQATAAPQRGGKTLLVLTFDEAVRPTFTAAAGNELILSVLTLNPGRPDVKRGGLVNSVSVVGTEVKIGCVSYSEATMMPSGAGSFILIISKAKPPAEPQRVVQQPVVQQKEPPQVQSEPARIKQEPVKQKQPESSRKMVSKPVNDQYDPEPIKAPETIEEDDPGDAELSDSAFTNMTGRRTTPIFTDLEIVQLPGSFEELPDRVERARRLMEQEEYKKAISLMKKIKPKDKDYGYAQLLLAEILVRQKKTRRALDYFRKATKNKKTAELASAKLALTFQRIGNLEAASSEWSRMFQLIDGKVYLLPESMRDEQPLPVAEDKEEEGKKEKRKGNKWIPLSILFGAIAVGGGLFGYKKYMDKKLKGDDDDEFGLPEYGFDDEDDFEEEEDTGGKKRVAKMYEEQKEPEPAPEPPPEEPTNKKDEAVEIPWGEEAEEEPPPPPPKPKPKPEPEPEEEDDSPSADWGDEATESNPKMRKIEAMHKQGASVRQIAETLGIGQDEVSMIIRLIQDEEPV